MHKFTVDTKIALDELEMLMNNMIGEGQRIYVDYEGDLYRITDTYFDGKNFRFNFKDGSIEYEGDKDDMFDVDGQLYLIVESGIFKKKESVVSFWVNLEPLLIGAGSLRKINEFKQARSF